MVSRLQRVHSKVAVSSAIISWRFNPLLNVSDRHLIEIGRWDGVRWSGLKNPRCMPRSGLIFIQPQIRRWFAHDGAHQYLSERKLRTTEETFPTFSRRPRPLSRRLHILDILCTSTSRGRESGRLESERSGNCAQFHSQRAGGRESGPAGRNKACWLLLVGWSI